MNFYDVIDKKKRGESLDAEEIGFFAKAAASGGAPDYQLSALLMAITLKGMSPEETYALAEAMADSGERLSFPFDTVDKHSTGGVGDCATFVVAPAAAALGLKMFKMSGRGLGFTGGTLDKLESIPGFNVNPDFDAALDQLKTSGLAVVGQSGGICPADKRLYAIRDVTATVDSVPLIAASVMSKKLAGGAKRLVLDVKCGRGAFMKTLSEAEVLARAMLDIAERAGVRASAVITDMDTPLSVAVGNAVEVYAAIEVLKGKSNNLSYVSKILLSELYDGKSEDIDAVLKDGSAFLKFRRLVEAQGGDVSYVDNPEKLLAAKYSFGVYAPKSGYIADIDALRVAEAVRFIGGGRQRTEDKIDVSAGVLFEAARGDFAEENSLLATLYYSEYEHMLIAKEIADSITISDKKPPEKDAVLKILRQER